MVGKREKGVRDLTVDQLNQEKFLTNISSRLGRERRSGVKPPIWKNKPYLHLYEGKTNEDLIEQFIDNLQLLNTNVDRITRQEFEVTLAKVLKDFEVNSAISWDNPFLHDLDLTSLLTTNGVENSIWNNSVSEDELKQRSAKVDLGITCADLGLAETGTVVFMNGEGRGRMVSLLPPFYLCILKESQIVPRITQAMEHIHAKVPTGLPACINFITGPSRTADIEMDLALGVHGPGKVHVILLRE
ncbi:lactate utilization protein C [Paenisporosarcina sp. TG20]|uniref:LutC/YkgG family protein n=1 Tax=Paenisporosarcina sp. TG20 TaxID=1211706 RepID=UPI0012F67D8B|nr:lactate utilization protein C [Paenisporosarcina sp. TG20]